ncbi:hypothetical protein AB0O31_20185 [Kitasatospora cineracea]|uniref:hypothetical protein n=1 Tax=Kitasatospora cineracea TaxID=88074 RepID=UPI0034438146
MARRVVRAVVLLAVAVLFPVLSAVGPASADPGPEPEPGGGRQGAGPGNGYLVTGISGVPARLAGGGGFTAVVTVASASHYRLLVDSLFLRVSDLDDPSGPQDGVSVEWQDPATGGWRPSDTHSGTGWGLTLARPFAVEPRGTLTFRARIALDAELPGGRYAVGTNGVAGYRLVDAAGNDVGLLEGRSQPQAVFRYAGPSPSPSPSGSPTATASAVPSVSASAAVSPDPVVAALPSAAPDEGTPSPAATSDAPVPAGSPTALSAPAGPGPGSGPDPGSGSGSGSGEGAAGRRPVGVTLVLGLVSIAAGFGLGAVSLLFRRQDVHR